MKWTDIEEIAEELENNHPDIDIMKIRFTDLHKWVTALPDFKDDPQNSNEKILEAIQAEWYELRD
jgi:FeS assembly protein IscX